MIEAEVGARDDAGVDLIAECQEALRRALTDAIAPRAIDGRTQAEILGDRLGQDFKLPAFQIGRQIARIGVSRIDRLVMGRIDPRMKMPVPG